MSRRPKPSPQHQHQHPHLFTCTFCWHLSRGPPHVLGRSARLTCELVVTGPTLAELFADDDDGAVTGSEEGELGLGLGAGREIAEVPACANCVAECDIDSANQQTIVQNALRKAGRIDGGMARKRWERREGQISRQAVGEVKRIPATTPKAVQNPPPLPIRPQYPAQFQAYTSHTSRLAGDGALSGSTDPDDDKRDCLVPLDSTIYVSILDPLGEPAFKPSPTKPIPSWMQWLPNQRDHRRKNEPRPQSIIDEHFAPHSISSTTKPESKPSTLCPTSPAQGLPGSTTHLSPPSGRHSPQSSEFSNLSESTIRALKGPSFVLDEPLQRPSSRIIQSAPHSPRAAIGESIAPPNPPETLPPRTRTPYSPRRPSPLCMHEETHDSGDVPWKETLQRRRPSSPLSEQVVAHFQRYIRRTPPAQSREFLNLYRPAQQPSPSVAVPGRARDRAVGDGRGIRNILGRDRSLSPGGERGGVGAEHAVTGSGEILDVRSMRKRSSLQGELKKLFGGRNQGR
ncbi:hypothetical protein F4677DRAFT_461111 [Hypoxylon crocopeplum]|nr:hypothetical protein F4677DRAFT_461111 [Hypoxylon crocopeplum]